MTTAEISAANIVPDSRVIVNVAGADHKPKRVYLDIPDHDQELQDIWNFNEEREWSTFVKTIAGDIGMYWQGPPPVSVKEKRKPGRPSRKESSNI
jgi:hypothetical protein